MLVKRRTIKETEEVKKKCRKCKTEEEESLIFTGRPVRVAVQKHLASCLPPRGGSGEVKQVVCFIEIKL